MLVHECFGDLGGTGTVEVSIPEETKLRCDLFAKAVNQWLSKDYPKSLRKLCKKDSKTKYYMQRIHTIFVRSIEESLSDNIIAIRLTGVSSDAQCLTMSAYNPNTGEHIRTEQRRIY